MTVLRPFQREFVRRALAPRIDTAALSIPRGNGKSWLAAHLLTRALTPGDPLHVPGSEVLLCAASIEQARLCFRFVRADLEPTGFYGFLDSSTRIGIRDKRDNTRLRVLSSNGKTSMGIVGCPLLVADEPGSWEVGGGTLMADAILTSQGKPNSPMRVIFIGTLAPATGGWWHDLVAAGSGGSTYVKTLKADPSKWDEWKEIRRVNPLSTIDADFRRKLRSELDAAHADTRLKARFLSYRLNLPTADESVMLLNVDDWQRVIDREVAPRGEGAPVVGIDCGGSRAWSAAVALYSTGRVEALAVAPGIPGLEAQERRDRVPAGVYRALHHFGALRVAEGLHVPPVAMLTDAVRERWGEPLFMVSDRFREGELRDAAPDIQLDSRVTRWSEAAYDIRALRRMAMDGPMSCDTESQQLLTASLAVAMVKNDDAGNVRMVKKSSANLARDDVASALVLAAGAVERHQPWAVSETPAYSGFF